LVLIIAEEFARPASGGDAAGVSVRLRRLLASLSESLGVGCESLGHPGLELGSGGTEGEDSLDVR
jgi:hypothetical protein